MNKQLFAFILFFLVAIPGLCDEVRLKNGDRISGTVVKLDGGNLVFKSEFAGQITLPWDAVTGLQATTPISVALKSGRVLTGKVNSENKSVQVETGPGPAGTITTDRDSLAALRSAEEQKAYEVALRPTLKDFWNGSFDVGFAQASGNANSTNFSLLGNATRITKNDKLNVFFNSLYATTNTNGIDGTTANARRGGISYNRDLTPKWFAFVQSNFEFDQFQSLDFRFNPAGGIGYHVFRSERGYLDLLAGGSYSRDSFSDGTVRNTSGIVLGNELSYKLRKNTVFFQKFQYFPNFASDGGYRLNFDATVATSINKWLAFQLGVSDRYLSNPLFGRQSNDIIYTTGLRLTFLSANQPKF